MKNRRRRRRVQLKPLGILVAIIFLAGILYILYVGLTDASLFSGTAPVSALAEEDAGEDAPEETGAPPTLSEEGEAPPAEEAPIPAPTPEAEANMFEIFTYYIPEKLPQYEAFQKEDPGLLTGDVVWMVNAGLNRPFFEEPNIITEANPLLVNPYNRVPDGFVPLELEPVNDAGLLATPDTVSAFNQMREGAQSDGFDLAVTSAYRTIEYQRGLYEREDGDGSVARPGFSEHHTGRALDLWGPNGLLDQEGPSDTGRWVAAHAHEYGFIVRYTEENRRVTGYISEPWHIVYVGGVIAWEVYNGGYGSLEEYVAKNPDLAWGTGA